ncbi:AraC-like regulator [Metarhizium acridum CQMa 102]|uniref:AraC-like regulator n=1 Tax=Metarhizium acridum (strain CQMa 102) TaxID=655827 RepID=E9DR15_METAQ|nr:AraC-like regulator [Metarhizium acridum CQMa 102]EFY93693.1 AraC-like regulator [Metarhizium acridum CQMa 102]
MDAQHEEYASTLKVNHFKPENVPWRRLGQCISTLPEKRSIMKGKVRFHVPGRPSVDVTAGEMVTVPVRLPHKFSNPFDEEAVFINTATPGFFVRYFEHLENLIGEGNVLTPEVNAEALKRFATIPLPPEDVNRLEETGMAGEKKRKAHNEMQ